LERLGQRLLHERKLADTPDLGIRLQLLLLSSKHTSWFESSCHQFLPQSSLKWLSPAIVSARQSPTPLTSMSHSSPDTTIAMIASAKAVLPTLSSPSSQKLSWRSPDLQRAGPARAAQAKMSTVSSAPNAVRQLPTIPTRPQRSLPSRLVPSPPRSSRSWSLIPRSGVSASFLSWRSLCPSRSNTCPNKILSFDFLRIAP